MGQTKIKFPPRVIRGARLKSIIIVLVFLGSFLLRFLVEPYRGTWVYQYGSPLSTLLFLGAIVWSFLNTVIIFLEEGFNFKEDLIWILISGVPFLYFVFMFFIKS